MKKKIITIMLSGVILAATLSVILNLSFRREIPFIEGMYWGMSPAKATKILGDCYEKDDLREVSKTTYRYRSVVLGEEAEISCYFWKDRELSDIYIQWDSNIENMASEAYTCLYEHYHSMEGFFQNTNDPISLGIDYNGPILRYQIVKDDTTVTVSCIDLR